MVMWHIKLKGMSNRPGYTENFYTRHFDSIKRPVARHGSILLGELVAILSVMEHLLSNSHQLYEEEIRIFCDTQTALGILTLNWTSNHYQDAIMRIKEAMSTLKSRGWKIEIVWTPGHSEVEGNEVADRLAKEAAVEAKAMEEETSVVTVQNIKRHARASIHLESGNKDGILGSLVEISHS